jgi:hypothetical protein
MGIDLRTTSSEDEKRSRKQDSMQKGKKQIREVSRINDEKKRSSGKWNRQKGDNEIRITLVRNEKCKKKKKIQARQRKLSEETYERRYHNRQKSTE